MKRIVLLLIGCAFALMAFAPSSAFAADGSGVVNSNENAATSIKTDSAAFGLSGVSRNQTGLNKTYQGRYYGYAFPLGKTASSYFAVVVTKSEVIAYVPADMARNAGFDLKSTAQRNAFQNMLGKLDVDLSDGGTELSSINEKWAFTSKKTYRQGKLTFRFDKEIEPGYRYVTCNGAGKEGNRRVASFCLSGQVLPADQVVVADSGSWFDQLMDFLSPENMDYRPLWVSLKTAGVAMVFIFVLGLLAARRCMHVKSRWKSLLDSVFTIPMVLPPTVVGFILLVIFGNSSDFGRFLLSHGIQLVFSWPAAVMAATVVGFPLMYRTCLGAFESLDVNMLDAARTLGWSEGRIFRKLMLPLSWPSIAAGIVLAFARAMGEFGATLFVAGNYAGITQTMPIAIYFAWMGGNGPVAVFWVVVVIIISFMIILIINLYSSHAQRYRKLGGEADGTQDEETGEVAFALDEDVAAELGFSSKRERVRGHGHTQPKGDDAIIADDKNAAVNSETGGADAEGSARS